MNAAKRQSEVTLISATYSAHFAALCCATSASGCMSPTGDFAPKGQNGIAMRTKNQIVNVPLNQIVIDFTRNPREPGDDNLRDTLMQASFMSEGQKVAVALEKVGPDDYRILQGNRRVFNLKEIVANGGMDGATVKRDKETGEIIPETGKTFETVKAIVYEDLTPSERLNLTIDHSNVKLLKKHELFRAVCQSFDVSDNERQTIVRLASLFMQFFPPVKTIVDPALDKGVDLLNNYRGLLQGMKRAYEAPEVVTAAYMDKLKNGGKGKITDATVKHLCEIYKAEKKADVMDSIGRHKPGPKFLAEWNKWVEAQSAQLEKIAAGETGRAVQIAMLTRAEVEKKLDALDSQVLRVMLRVVLRQRQEDVVSKLDRFMVEIESGLTYDQKKVLAEIGASESIPTSQLAAATSELVTAVSDATA